jgi:uncharacterized protein YjeT (DUF2065 family)
MSLRPFILITALIEIFVGAGLFIMPEAIPEMAGQSAMALTMTRMYGAAAVAIGYYAFMVWQNFDAGPATGFLKTFIVFHIGVAVASYFGYSQGIESFIPVMALHTIMALMSIFYFVSMRSSG